jgi:hypothetical protein
MLLKELTAMKAWFWSHQNFLKDRTGPIFYLVPPNLSKVPGMISLSSQQSYAAVNHTDL